MKGVRMRRIEQATQDGKLIAVYCPDDMGAKGRIGVRVEKSENVIDLMENGFPCFVVNGEYYKAIEYPVDYPALMSRFHWYLTNKASAYSD